MRPLYGDRVEAGQVLARDLAHLGSEDVVVLGLPRGGVPVARQVADALGAPLDVILVRKLGVPGQPEVAMGAIGEGDVRVLEPRTIATAGVSEEVLGAVERRERQELERRATLYREGRPAHELQGRTVVIVDDGIATGSTVRAAARVARALGAVRVVVATPVAPADIVDRLGPDVDEVVASAMPDPFWAIGAFYRDFRQTRDDEVIRLLGER
ncbi:MAG: phosphoribosyltransferase [Acidimicrobiia bacterium]